MNRQQFIATVAPVIVKVRIDGGVLFPSVSLAQTILETGGRIPEWNNVVGLKVGSGITTPYWHGQRVNTSTWEVYDGVRYDNVSAEWRAYDSIEESLKDQALLFLRYSRYQGVLQANTPEQQAEALQRSGYATDPEYASKLKAIMRTGGYAKFDREAEAGMEALKELQQQVAELKSRVEETTPPDWAKPTIDKLIEMQILHDPKGDRSLFRALVVLDRAGVFDKEQK